MLGPRVCLVQDFVIVQLCYRATWLHQRAQAVEHLPVDGAVDPAWFDRHAEEALNITWLMVGWTQPVWMALMVATASSPPAAPKPCPIMDLVPFMAMCFQSLNTDLTAFTSAMSPTSVLVAWALM
jgi:hypothetical protein